MGPAPVATQGCGGPPWGGRFSASFHWVSPPRSVVHVGGSLLLRPDYVGNQSSTRAKTLFSVTGGSLRRRPVEDPPSFGTTGRPITGLNEKVSDPVSRSFPCPHPPYNPVPMPLCLPGLRGEGRRAPFPAPEGTRHSQTGPARRRHGPGQPRRISAPWKRWAQGLVSVWSGAKVLTLG